MTPTIAFDLRPLSIPEKAQRGTSRIALPLLREAARHPEVGRLIILVSEGQDVPSAAAPFEVVTVPWRYGDISERGWYGESRRMGRFLNALRPDMYHAPDLYYPRGFRGPVVVTVCDHFDLPLVGPARLFGHTYGWRWNLAFRFRYRWTWRTLLRGAAGVAAISVTTAERVRRRYPEFGNRLSAIPLGLEDEWFDPAPPDPGLLDRYGLSRPLVLHVGGLERRKNPEGVLGSFERFRRDHPTATLVLAGPLHGPKREGAGVRVLGFVPRADLKALYSQADALLFPSYDEGFGVPVLEALAHGCPVVTSRGTATEEAAAGHAVLVDPFDADDILAGLRKALAAPRPAPCRDLRRSSETAAGYFALYESCLRESREGRAAS